MPSPDRTATWASELQSLLNILAAFIADYNNERPYSSLKYQTSAAYATNLTATGKRLRYPDQLRQSPLKPSAPRGGSSTRTLKVVRREPSGRSALHGLRHAELVKVLWEALSVSPGTWMFEEIVPRPGLWLNRMLNRLSPRCRAAVE